MSLVDRRKTTYSAWSSGFPSGMDASVQRVARAIACIPRTLLRKTMALSDLTLMLDFYSDAHVRAWVRSAKMNRESPHFSSFFMIIRERKYTVYGSLSCMHLLRCLMTLRPCRRRNQRNVAARAGFRPANDLPRYSTDE